LEESHPNELWDDHPDVLREESLNVMKRSKKTVAY